MKVKLLTTEQARYLHMRFDHWFEVQPIPVKPDKWIVTIDCLLALKEAIIDNANGKPRIIAKAMILRDSIKDLPTYELDDYPEYLYNHEDEAELAEYTARFADLVFENVDE
jgi:hypothetical protein